MVIDNPFTEVKYCKSSFTLMSDSVFFLQTSMIDPDKAIHSLPSHFEVRDSGIHGAGLGVWATQEIPTRVVFGPYGGEILYNPEIAHSSGYAWQVLACI